MDLGALLCLLVKILAALATERRKGHNHKVGLWRPHQVSIKSMFSLLSIYGSGIWAPASTSSYQQRGWETIWQGAPLGHRLAARHEDGDTISRYLVWVST